MALDGVHTDRDRLWQSLMAMAKISATPTGGVARLALTDLDRQARDLFVSWCREAGCELRVDRIGNIFARRPGLDAERPPVMTGSHLDTQPLGGKFDGIYGVLAGLEVVRTLNDARIDTLAPIEVAVWTDEEGVRFGAGTIGSGAFAGRSSAEAALGRSDLDGVTIAKALAVIGYAGDAPVGGYPVEAFFEVHIEQGPLLERSGVPIGVGIMAGSQGGKELFWSTYKTRCGDRDSCPSLSPECEAPTATGFVNHLLFSSEPLEGDGRMKAASCCASRSIRVLSPRMLPPVTGLLGSTASTATRWPAPIRCSPNASMKVLLPTPGGPVIPTRCAARSCRSPRPTSSARCPKGSRSSTSTRCTSA